MIVWVVLGVLVLVILAIAGLCALSLGWMQEKISES